LGIGDGSSTRIETDNWIPGVSPVLLKSQVPLLENQMVSTLILEDTRYWDVDLVRTIFPEDVVTQVLQVPISCHSGEDFASWPYTRFGCYTLGSGCNLGRTDNFSDQRSTKGCGLSSDTDGDSKLWKTLWSAKASVKMKITL
jgi:hypothetical protein